VIANARERPGARLDSDQEQQDVEKSRKGTKVGWYGSGCGDVHVTKANLERMLAEWERRGDPDAPGYCEGYWSPRPLGAFSGLERFEAWHASYDLEPTYDDSGELVALDLNDDDKHPYRSPEDVLGARSSTTPRWAPTSWST